MARTTIDFGIDLGTTNSTIAVLNGMDVHVIKNNDGAEFTPSAVHIDKSGNLIVGRTAKERREIDPENSAAEFKALMGKSTEFIFQRSKIRMKPEELSAEVLKQLKADVKQRTGEEVRHAVITVPAIFDLPECAATNTAAQKAGFGLSPLLQEPVAAAMAYGFHSTSDKEFWLVFDFGGGTFDAAIMQVRDGIIEVYNHGGDRELGGKLIDWDIVEKLLIPAVTSEHPLTDFSRENKKWQQAIAKLKLNAEEAKITCSRYDSAEITIDYLCQNDRGAPVQFDYKLYRKDVETITRPYFVRALNYCHKVLKEKRLKPSDISKVLLVGGPTLMPILREFLADPKEGLGVPLDFHIDPLTVVAQGAAIFAGTQRIEETAFIPAMIDGEFQYQIKLDFKPVGTDPEPLVGGQVIGKEGEDLSSCRIEFINAHAKQPYRSGKISLNENGFFMTNLWAEADSENIYQIELTNPQGDLLKSAPDHLVYKLGIMTVANTVLINSVAVVTDANEAIRFFEKGTPLPARKHKEFRTSFDLRKGYQGDLIIIPVVEGESIRRADRNRLIGKLEIKADQIKRDVPLGSTVDVTVEINESRLVKTKAYIEVLDEEFEDILPLSKQEPNPGQLEKEFEQEQARLDSIKEKLDKIEDENAKGILERIAKENMINDVYAALKSASNDPHAAATCQSRLLDLKKAIDDIEDIREWPALVIEAEGQLEWLWEVVNKYGKIADKEKASLMERELKKIIEARMKEPDLLQRQTDEIYDFHTDLRREQPGFWMWYLDYEKERKERMKDKSEAEMLFAQADRAIAKDDFADLRSAVRQLWALLPMQDQMDETKIVSTIHI